MPLVAEGDRWTRTEGLVASEFGPDRRHCWPRKLQKAARRIIVFRTRGNVLVHLSTFQVVGSGDNTTNTRRKSMKENHRQPCTRE